MCNALDPEKSVMWLVLHDHCPPVVRAAHFTHPVYRAWFGAVERLRHAACAVTATALKNDLKAHHHVCGDRDWRALQRMLRVAPPARIVDNGKIFSQALIDRHRGDVVHLQKLIN